MVKITKSEMYDELKNDVNYAIEEILYNLYELPEKLNVKEDEYYLADFIYFRIRQIFREIKLLLKQYEKKKINLIEHTHMKDDLRRHEVAVFLNTECSFIYDIALNVSEYL